MNTTNVFVELLVIGLGPLTALLLVILVVLDPGAGALGGLLGSASSLATLVPMLAATYVLGIIADRLADTIFGRPASRIRHRYFQTDDEYHDARRTIIYYAEPIYRVRQYGRSRMRICRGWAVNSVLLVLPANAFVLRFWGGLTILLLVNVGLILTFLGTTLSWRTLAHGEYRKIKGGAEFIRGELEGGGSPGLRLHD
jgi:hypothetical protein